MVKNTDNIPTLLPYLESRPGRFFLQLFVGRQEPSSSAAVAAASFAVDDSDPLSRVLAARIITDAGSGIRPVWLRIQRDVYDCATDPLQALTNPQIEECWQRTFAARRAAKEADQSFFLDEQIGPKDELLPFASLFCCHAKQTFFHPPCPSCGRPLVLCRDDDLLAERHLATYSNSLRRFLFCPDCAENETGTPFYVFTRSGKDDAAVHDHRQLVLAWGQMARDAAMATGLPCLQCTGHEACFGRNSLVLENISPLSFYPFYMLLGAAGDLNGSDFLALLGGAEPQELILHHTRAGQGLGVRQLGNPSLHDPNRGFLYSAADPRRFYEVLFLKLTFLQELATDLAADAATARYPDISLLLSTVSVQVQPGGMLPFFWNFRLRRDGIGQFLAGTVPLPTQPPSYTFYALGFLWLSALLVNAGQDVTVLYGIMNRYLQDGKGEEDMAVQLAEHYPKVFAPACLFWNRKQVDLDEQGLAIWQRVLALGLDLVDKGFHGAPLSAEALLQQIADLRQEVKKVLLPQSSVPEEASVPEPVAPESVREDSNREIHAILARIGARWQSSQAGDREGPPDEEPEEQNAIFTGSDREQAPEVVPDEKPDLQETVILTPDLAIHRTTADRGRVPAPSPATRMTAPARPVSAAEGGGEPLVPGAGAAGNLPAQTGIPPQQIATSTEDSEETVILRPNSTPDTLPADARNNMDKTDSLLSRISPAGQEENKEDTLAETIILKPGNRKKNS